MIRAASPYVFPGKYADRPRENLSPLLKRVRAKAGLPETFRPLRGLRHSFASWPASSGKVSSMNRKSSSPTPARR
ncbi:MAG: hypothetical protein LBQ63_00485 [Deltaproteobacteria bacterium]|nr:hypothetical protein [Deltaproteobacteria bacterium]